MNIRDLIDTLEEIAEASEDGGNLEVRFASQPNWPFEYSVSDVLLWDKAERVEAEIEGARQECDDAGEEYDLQELREVCESNIEHEMESEGKPDCVYLVEGSQLGYLPGGPKDAMGW